MGDSVPLILPTTLRKSVARNGDHNFFLNSRFAYDSGPINDDTLDVSGDTGVVGRLFLERTGDDSKKRKSSDEDEELILDFKGKIFKCSFEPCYSTFVVAINGEKARIESVMNMKLDLNEHLESNWLDKSIPAGMILNSEVGSDGEDDDFEVDQENVIKESSGGGSSRRAGAKDKIDVEEPLLIDSLGKKKPAVSFKSSEDVAAAKGKKTPSKNTTPSKRVLKPSNSKKNSKT